MNSSIKYYPLVLCRRLRRQHKTIDTLDTLYGKWLPTKQGAVSQSAMDSYRIAYDHIRPIAHIPVTQLSYRDMQAIIDTMRNEGLSYASVKKVRTLLSLLTKFAQVNDIPMVDYTKHLALGQNIATLKRAPFTRQQINRLWHSPLDTDGALILLYTGMRCGEMLALTKKDINLKQRTIPIRKSKTISGIRIIPIHHRIYPIIEQLYQSSNSRLFNITYPQFRSQFKKLMKSINCTHTTHDCRHTVASLLDRYGANPNAVRSILGHKTGDVTIKVYTHKAIRELRKTIELLP